MFEPAFGDEYSGGGGWRRAGELYSAYAGLVVSDSSPYGLWPDEVGDVRLAKADVEASVPEGESDDSDCSGGGGVLVSACVCAVTGICIELVVAAVLDGALRCVGV